MKAEKRRILWLVCALLCVALAAGACTPGQPALSDGDQAVNIAPGSERDPESISVNGAGKVLLEPDTATLYVSVTSRGEDVATVQADNAAKVEAVTAAILAVGVEKENVQTYAINLNEDYDYKQSPVVITGYEMRTSLYITVTPLEKAGAVIGEALAAGATNTGAMEFTVADTSEAYKKAYQIAIADAVGKANAMAEALGVRISDVPLSITETSQSSPVAQDRSIGTALSSAAAAPISAGQIEIVAAVRVVYELIEPDAAP